jgi:thiamine biosynthesis lipoprotein
MPTIRAHRATGVAMATLVTAEVVTAEAHVDARAALDRALGWFAAVERACSRFDEASELRRLVARVGEPVEVSPLLFESIRFALALADLTDGVFDPTIGRAMVEAGFDRHYATGERATATADRAASFKDVAIDEVRRTVELRRPLLLDLGAVAKGLAIDLAARELVPLGGCCVEAGGDLYAGGRNDAGEPWRIGVQHPRDPDAMVEVLELTDQAACTSGDYERRTTDGAGHHLIDPRTGRAADSLASVTVVAPTAMAADGLATAAFVLGPAAGRRLLVEQGVEGLFVTLAGAVDSTAGLGTAAR